MLSFADSLLIKHKNTKSKNELKIFFLVVNNKICLPPLPVNEITSIWESAEKFVNNLESQGQLHKPSSSLEKQALIESATENILSKYRLLTIE